MNSNSRKKIKPKNENKVMKDNLFYQTLRFLKTLESPPAGHKIGGLLRHPPKWSLVIGQNENIYL